MADIVSDLGENINWKCYKAGQNDFTITCTESSAAFNISSYVFTLRIRKLNTTADLLTLTEGAGITNGGASGILTISLTETQANVTLPGFDYFYELAYVVNSQKKRMIQGSLNLSAETNPSSSATSLSATINMGGSNVSASITLAGASVTSASIATALGAQTANTFYAGPSSGVAANPAFRPLVDADLPNLLLVSVSDAITLDSTAFGKLHVCIGTAADYTVVLPTAVGNTGKAIGFLGGIGLTRFITLDGGTTETIAGSTTKVFWSNESFTLVSDGANWNVTNQSLRSLLAVMRLSANQTGVVVNTQTKILVNSTELDNSTRMANTTSRRIDIKRTGNYRVIASVAFNNITGAIVTITGSIYKNGAVVDLFYSSGYALNVVPHIIGTSILSLTAGDYIELYALHNNASNQVLLGAASAGGICKLTVVEEL